MKKTIKNTGFTLIEVILAMALLSIVVVGTLAGNSIATKGTVLTRQRSEASRLAKEGMDALASVRAAHFTVLNPGTFHPVSTPQGWALVNGSEQIGVYTRKITLTSVTRALACQTLICDFVAQGGVVDGYTLRAETQVDWLEEGIGKQIVLDSLITYWR